MADLSNIRTIYFKGEALIHNKEQGKDYLTKVEFRAELDLDGEVSIVGYTLEEDS